MNGSTILWRSRDVTLSRAGAGYLLTAYRGGGIPLDRADMEALLRALHSELGQASAVSGDLFPPARGRRGPKETK